MNLHAIAGPIVAAVNPPVLGQYQQSTGSNTAASGKRTPTYATAIGVQVQLQALTGDDLRQMDGLNIQGEKRALYVSGTWKGASRPDIRGGDLFTLPDGSIWLVVHLLEDWNSTAGWAKVAITRQNGA